jgi:hypothetical protein
VADGTWQLQGLNENEGVYWYGGWSDLPIKISGEVTAYGGAREPFRLVFWWDWDPPLPPGSEFLTLTPTPFAMWTTVSTDSIGQDWYAVPIEVMPGVKTWPTRGVYAVLYDYKGDLSDPFRGEAYESWSLKWETRGIYLSAGLNSNMPRIQAYAEIQYFGG